MHPRTTTPGFLRPRTADFLPLLAAGLAAACGAHPSLDDDVTGGEELATAAQAVTTPSWINPECSESGLGAGTAGSCNGPWTYTEQLWCTGTHPDCPDVCIDHASCASWWHGAVEGSPANYSGGSKSHSCRQTCDLYTGECSDVACGAAPDLGFCAAAVPAKLNLVTSNINAQIDTVFDANLAQGYAPLFTRQEVKSAAATFISGSGDIETSESESTRIVGKREIITWTTTYSCRIQVTRPAPATGESQACLPACDAFGDSSCTHKCGTAPRATAPGAPMPFDGAGNITDVSCSTCDDQPFATDGQVDDKFACLNGKLSAPVPVGQTAADYRAALIARFKLLLEWRAPLLDSAQEQQIRGYYADEAGEPACEADLAVAAEYLAEGDAIGLTGRVQLCQNLTRDGVPLAVVADQLDFCLGAFDLLPQLGAGYAAWRDLVAQVNGKLVARMMEHIVQTGTGPSATLTQLPVALSAIERWYDHAALAAGGDADWLRHETSAVLGAFWARAYSVLYTLPGTVDATTAAQVINQLDSSSLTAEFAVIAAAFGPGVTLDSPPLLALVADALRTSVDRLETVSEVRDIACRYRACSPASASQTAEMWRLLASLHDEGLLAAAVTTSPRLAAAHPEVLAGFQALSQNHARLRAAYAAAGATSPLALLIVTEAALVPPEAAGLAILVALADLRWTTFQTYGVFVGGEGRALHAGMQNKQLIIDQLDARVDALAASHAAYVDDRAGLVQALLGELQNGTELESLRGRAAMVLERYSDLSRDLIGLQTRENDERRRFAAYAMRFEELRDAGAVDEEAAADSDQLPALTLRGDQARFTSSRAIDDVAVRVGSETWKQPLDKGQTLRFQVTGQWSPSCALTRSTMPGETWYDVTGPNGQDYTLQTNDNLIGPEGYMVEFSGSSFHSHSNTNTDAQQFSANVDLCLKISQGTPGGIEFLFGSKMEVWMQACLGYSATRTSSESYGGGGETRVGASYAGGVHLRETPFPAATAGALLLVVTPPGVPSQILDVQVVSREMVYVPSRDVDTYLVINDRAVSGTGCQARPQAITVTPIVLTSFGAIAEAVKEAMADSLLEIEQAAPAILAQGGLMPGEEDMLRLHARQRVALNTGVAFADLPPAIGEFFDGWLAMELVSLHRRARIEQTERELRQTLHERELLSAQADDAEAQGRLAQLLPRWQLRQLQQSRLLGDRRALTRYLRDFVPPIYELRFPRALRDLVTSPDPTLSAAAELSALEFMDFAASPEELAGKLLALANKVVSSLEGAVADSHDYGVVMAAVAFPDDEAYLEQEEADDTCGQFGPCNEAGQAPATNWFAVERTRAKQVWDALRVKGKATFTITPADLYSEAGGSGQLTCYDSAPVIRKMAIYAVTSDGNDYSTLFYRPAFVVDPLLSFPVASGVASYEKVDTDWLFSGIPVLGGAESEALSDLVAHNSSAASGLSPFGTFEVNLASFPISLDVTQQLVVVFELETRPIAAPGVLIEECR